MTSIVHIWHENNLGGIQKGVDKLTEICGGKQRHSELTEIKAGRRKLPDCFLREMLDDNANSIFSKHKYKRERPLIGSKRDNFIDELSGLVKHRDMLDKYLPLLLADYGYSRDVKILKKEWSELLDKLSPPERIER